MKMYFWTYLILFLIPFAYQLVQTRDEFEVIFCNVLCLSVKTFFALVEVPQIIYLGPKEYISWFQNQVDFLSFTLGIVYHVIRI